MKKTFDVQQVATFRLPISVKSLCAMVDGLTREYGKGLTMRQVGDSLIIEQPNAPREAGAVAPSLHADVRQEVG